MRPREPIEVSTSIGSRYMFVCIGYQCVLVLWSCVMREDVENGRTKKNGRAENICEEIFGEQKRDIAARSAYFHLCYVCVWCSPVKACVARVYLVSF